MRIASDLRDEIVAHAREAVPNECCGLLGGRDGAVTSVYRTRNEFDSPLAFRIPGDEHIRVYNEAEGRGEEIIASYHSHTKSEARPSQTDINETMHWGADAETVMLICSLAADPPVVRAFRIRAGEVEELELTVAEG